MGTLYSTPFKKDKKNKNLNKNLDGSKFGPIKILHIPANFLLCRGNMPAYGAFINPQSVGNLMERLIFSVKMPETVLLALRERTL